MTPELILITVGGSVATAAVLFVSGYVVRGLLANAKDSEADLRLSNLKDRLDTVRASLALELEKFNERAQGATNDMGLERRIGTILIDPVASERFDRLLLEFPSTTGTTSLASEPGNNADQGRG